MTSGDHSTGVDIELVGRAVDERDAVAFVHVGDRFDDNLRYLTRFQGPDRPYGVCYVDGELFCVPPQLFEADARESFAGTVVAPDDRHPGEQIASLLADYEVDAGTVLTPRTIPHDAAAYIQSAGYDLASTDVLARARRQKTDTELDRIAAVQSAAHAGMDRAREVLQEATQDGTALLYDGARLTTERLRREVNAVMAAEGVTPAQNTVIGTGPSCADLHYRGTDPIAPDAPVLLDLSPRGQSGYYGDFTRAYLPDPDEGWARRAHVAVKNARSAALAVLDTGAGVTAGTVHTEAAAEIVAYGFKRNETPGFTHSVGHGVGLSLHERPSLRSDTELVAGDVVTIEPGVYDPEYGGVRIEDIAVVEADGYRLLGGEYETTMQP